MAYTPNITAGNGSVTDFQVTFPYLRQAHVGVKVNGVVVSKTWVNAGMIRVSPAPGSGVSVEVYRDTPSVPLATLQNNKPIPAASYNDLVKQALYFAEEQAYLTALGTATDRVQTGLDRAAVAADKITVAADKATVAADKATVAADKATTSGYKDSASTSASTATTQATTATTQATLAGKWASEVEDTPVTTGPNKFSALHWAAKAAASAATAASIILGDFATITHAATSKTTPVDNDEFGGADSAASWGLKKFTFGNIKATLKTYFDTLYATVAHNHAATAITSGTLADARLPARLGLVAQTVTDWNNALDNGWYMGSGTANAPGGSANWFLGNVEAHGSTGWRTQTVHSFTLDGSGATYVYRRSQNNGTWEAWYLLQLSQAEQDARYLQLTAALGQGQSWQDMSASREFATSYQNTTGKPIVVIAQYWATAGTGTSTSYLMEVSANNSTWFTAGANGNTGNATNANPNPSAAVVPNGHYYRLSRNTGTGTVKGFWNELR
jgi:hypothetical protein